MIRQPMIVVMGHVDHGKTLFLDRIRSSAMAAKEAGGITQSIGASNVPLDVIKKVCGDLLNSLKINLTIPGLLFIDTPGHAAFTSLRKRGGNLADIAILVIDINEGLMPQTVESIEILKNYKTPFIIAANKIDLIRGWKQNSKNLIQDINSQARETVTEFEKKMYETIAKLSELGLNSERFDRVDDYTKQVALVPISAKTGQGIPELLMVLTGLTQKYLEQCLECNKTGNAKGTVLEVKEEKGLGTCVDAIIYDGTLKVNDTIVIGGIDKPIVTKVRVLLQPQGVSELRDKKTKFVPIKEISAAAGVRISAPNIGGVVSGAPFVSTTDVEKTIQEIQAEINEVLIETDEMGLVIKADSLGSLEAMTKLLKDKGIPVKSASVGNITKSDISKAHANYEKDPLLAVILGFNVSVNPEAEKELSGTDVKILTNEIIYRLLEDFDKWKEEQSKLLESKELDDVIRPCKILLLPHHTFRQNNPAIMGVEILAGNIKTGTELMKNGKAITYVKSLQLEKEGVSLAKKGQQLAMSMEGVTVGRQINENDILYSAIPESDFRKMKELKKYLTNDEIDVLKEIAEIMRKENPVWGI